jgi:DNA-binding CsgD family transcriptional regulator
MAWEVPMYKLKTINNRVISVIGFSLSFSYVLSFLFEGQVLYNLIEYREAEAGSYIFVAIIATFAGLFSGGFFAKSAQKAKDIITIGMLLCLFVTVPFFFAQSILWHAGLIIASYVCGCAVASWGYFLKIFTPKNQRIKTCADILIYSNIAMILTNVTAIHVSPFAGLTLSIFCLIAGTVFIRMLPLGHQNIADEKKPKQKENVKKPLVMLYLFVFVITINSGLMYQVANPSFEHLTELTSWYWAVPYITALAFIRNLAHKIKRPLILYTGMGMLAASFISFMLMGRGVSDYLIINTLMLGAFGIFDLFWWSILGEMLDYTDNPAKTFGIGLSANVLGIICGGTVGMQVTSIGLSGAEVAVIALSVVCITLAMLPLLNNMLVALLKKHAYLWEEIATTEHVDNHMTEINSTLNALEPLTAREQEVLQFLISGKSNKAIAEDLFISESTVKTHVRNIYSKYNVSGRTELICILLKNKISI